MSEQNTEDLRTSAEWSEEFGVTIMDPDGWDRKNFEESWGEKISRNEFHNRMFRSTIGPASPFRNHVDAHPKVED